MSGARLASIITLVGVLALGCRATKPVSEKTAPTPTLSAAAAANRSVYFILVDRFENGDPTNDALVDPSDAQGWHGGDLRGVINRLDYLEELGVTTLWLSPIFTARSAKIGEHGAYHGYWTFDLMSVDPRFGTEDELRELGEALESRGMDMVLDLVVNHVGYEAPLLSERPDWFHREGTIEDWSDEEQLERGQVHGLPDLAQENDEVYEYLLRAATKWLAFPGVAGYRLDAVKHVDQPFWRRFLTDLRSAAARELVLIGEVFDGAPRVLAAYSSLGFTHVFDFALYYAATDVVCRKQNPMRLAAVLSADSLYGARSALVGFADNHDLPRLRSSCATEQQAVSMIATTVLMRDTPVITYGSESGLSGAGEPENRADMKFSGPSETKTLLRRLLAARARLPALRGAGADITLRSDVTMFSVARVGADHAVILSFNRGTKVERPVPSGFPSISVEEELISGQGGAAAVLARPGVTAYVVRGDFSALLDNVSKVATVRWTLPTSDERELVLGGSLAQLGAWSAEGAPPFVGGSVEITVPVGATIEYKLGMATADGGFEWESGDNRYLYITRDSEVAVSWRE